MPICTFFLQNKCRFGENCKFEHPRGGGGGASSVQRNLFGGGSGQKSVTFRDTFGSFGNQGNNQFKWGAGQQGQGSGQGSQSQTTATDIVNNLPKEIEAWEKTKMWPFSCMSVEREMPCLPEFHDVSTEEIRYEAYQAQKAGTMQAFNQKLQSLASEYQTKRNQIRQMPVDCKQKLASFIDDARRKKISGASTTSSSSSASLFGSSGASSSASSSVFGSKSNSTNLFGSNSSATNTTGGLFSKSTTNISGNPFGTSSATSLFGKSTQSQGNAFGAQNSSMQTGNSIFGQPSTPNNSMGLFGNKNTVQSTSMTPIGQSLFGSSNTTGVGSSTGSLFGKPAINQNTPSVFGNTSTPTMSTPGTSGLFGMNQSTSMGTSLFGNPMTTQQIPQPTQGIFGSSGNSMTLSSPMGGNVFGSSPSSSPNMIGASPMGTGSATATNSASLFGKPVLQSQVPSGLFSNSSISNPNSQRQGLLPTPTSSFPSASASTTAPQHGLFGKGLPTVGTQAQGFNVSSSNGLFGSSPSNVMVGNDANQTIYSKMEDLSPQDIEAFKADEFEMGKIPIKPPPRELITR